MSHGIMFQVLFFLMFVETPVGVLTEREELTRFSVKCFSYGDDNSVEVARGEITGRLIQVPGVFSVLNYGGVVFMCLSPREPDANPKGDHPSKPMDAEEERV